MTRALTATAAVSSASTAHDTLLHSENLHFYLFIYIFNALSYSIIQSSAKLSIFLNVLPRAFVPQDGILRHLSHAHQLPAHCLLPLLARANVGAPTFYS